jgi:hypothetical protein
MLALAFAAAHPLAAEAPVLGGCGTFDPVARSRLCETLREREEANLPLYTCEATPLIQEEGSEGPFDRRAHVETWDDMVRLKEEGVYPSAFHRSDPLSSCCTDPMSRIRAE